MVLQQVLGLFNDALIVAAPAAILLAAYVICAVLAARTHAEACAVFDLYQDAKRRLEHEEDFFRRGIPAPALPACRELHDLAREFAVRKGIAK